MAQQTGGLPATDPSRLAWYKRASANLRESLVKLEADLADLRSRGIDARATEQLIAEVKRRLAELERLLAATDPDT